jgi:hypothetical protein
MFDLHSIPAGEYQLAVRRQDEDWHFYRQIAR